MSGDDAKMALEWVMAIIFLFYGFIDFKQLEIVIFRKKLEL